MIILWPANTYLPKRSNDQIILLRLHVLDLYTPCGALVNTGKHVSTPSMASLRGSSKRLLFEEGDHFSRDPGAGSCTCGNICNRVEKRGACPCLKAGRFCSASCLCGSKKRACTNKPGVRGSVLSEELGVTPLAAATDQRDRGMSLYCIVTVVTLIIKSQEQGSW